ncbi:MAG: hypothetical protein Q7J29_15700 [Stagnimonas sp.]|nr:hypothetical protein [Stagnimonas sp.]
MKKTSYVLAMSAVAGILTACGGGSGGFDGPVITIPTAPPVKRTVQLNSGLGALVNSTCLVYALPKMGTTAPVGRGTTDATNGFVALDVFASASNPTVIECNGGEYFDEGTGVFAPLGSKAIRVTVSPERISDLATTTLTEIASAVATRRLGLLTPEEQANGAKAFAEIDAAYKDVANAFLPGFDLRSKPALVNSTTPVLGGGNQAVYALYLAGLSVIAKDAGVTLIDLIATLDADISDGNLDGLLPDASTAKAKQSSLYASFEDLLSKLDAAAKKYAEDTGNAAALDALNQFLDAVAALREGVISNTPSGGTGTGTGTGSG